MPKYYFYKMTVDNRGAPCVQSRLLSLAICKPEIRRCAQAGDWIFGFGANYFQTDGHSFPGNPLVFAARVTGKADGAAYYTNPAYSERRDCIYELRAGRFARRVDALYHDRPGDLPHDLGEYPHYPKSTVLLSDDFRYFPNGGMLDYKARVPPMADAIANVHRGHRVAHPGTQLATYFDELRRWLWGKFPEAMIEADGAKPGGAPVRRIADDCPPVVRRPKATPKLKRLDC